MLTKSKIISTGTAALLLATAGCSMGSDSEKPAQTATLEILPPIVQPGASVDSPDQAKLALVGTVKPAVKGRTILLEKETAEGWKVVEEKSQVGPKVEFTAPNQEASYRITAATAKSLSSVESDEEAVSQIAPLWTDEFTGNELNPAWIMRGQEPAPESMRACSKGDPSAVKVLDGTLRLSILEDKSRTDKCMASKSGEEPAPYAYRLNGHIGTMNTFSFKYGTAAARIKMQPERGQHASFWMQPAVAPTPGAEGQEIDVIEYFGDDHPMGGLTSFTHTPAGDEIVKVGSWIKDSESFLSDSQDGWSNNYHVFSVEWEPNLLIFRIDGKETWRTKKPVSNVEQYLILSLLASDYELPEMEDTQLPQHMYVDWVRVWGSPEAQ